MPTPLPQRSDDPRSTIGQHWKGFVALGAFTALLGLAALVLTAEATIASVLLIGMLMTFAGIAEIVVGFRMRSWGRFIAWEVAGIFYILAGGFAILVPEIASVYLTLLLGAGLIATGISRVVFGFNIGSVPRRNARFFSGGVTALLGLLVVLGWPGNSPLILGTLLGVELLFNGITWVALGLKLRA